MDHPADPRPRPARGRPRSEPADEQRRRILAAGREAFGHQPYDSVTVSSIAEAAAVPRAVVYELIGSKEAILEAVGDQVATEIAQLFRGRLAGGVDGSPSAEDRAMADPAVAQAALRDLIVEEVAWSVEALANDRAAAAIVALSGRAAGPLDALASEARLRIEDAIAALYQDRARLLGFDRHDGARLVAAAILALVERATLRTVQQGWDVRAAGRVLGEFVAGGLLAAEFSGAVHEFEEGMAGGARLGDGTGREAGPG